MRRRKAGKEPRRLTFRAERTGAYGMFEDRDQQPQSCRGDLMLEWSIKLQRMLPQRLSKGRAGLPLSIPVKLIDWTGRIVQLSINS
mmetsp:Transcript_33599/g.132521  ORF Transcript_33599/g.132521 Transcript_33599/m.132521 type:complete len:86 (+) Transcript_33599:1436-1693(+)